MERIKNIQIILSKLPEINYQTLRLLIWFLNCYMLVNNSNSIDAGNIATVWTPSILSSDKLDLTKFDPFEPREVIKFIIEHYSKIFPEDQ